MFQRGLSGSAWRAVCARKRKNGPGYRLTQRPWELSPLSHGATLAHLPGHSEWELRSTDLLAWACGRVDWPHVAGLLLADLAGMEAQPAESSCSTH